MIFYNEEGEAKDFGNPGEAFAAGYYLTKPPTQPATDVEIPVAAQADFVRELDGTYYYFWKIPLVEEELYTYYTSDTLFDGQNFEDKSPDDVLSTSVFFGVLEQIPAEFKDKNPIELFISEIKAEAVKNPFLLKKEEAGAVNQLGEDIGGQYSVLNTYLESLFEGKTLSYTDYAVNSNIINNLTGDQLTYFKAIALGTDSQSNATLRNLENKAMLEVSGLMTKYGLVDLDETLTDFLYNQRLTGEYDTGMLAEQFRLLAFPELPGYRDPEFTQFIADNMIDVGISKANINKVEQKILSKLGPDLGSGFTAEDKRTLSNVYGIQGGDAILDAQLQEVWDANVSDRYKGKSYNIALASLRPVLSKEGNFDENGRDKDLVYTLLNTEDTSSVQKIARQHFLGVNDEGALSKMASGLRGQGLSQVIAGGAITGVY